MGQTTNNKQQTTNNKQQTTNNQQPTTNNQQPTTNNQQPTNNKQQTTNNKTNNKQQTTNNRVVASCHLEMTPPPIGTEPVDHHMHVARQVKEFFHKAGIHSTTIQLEYWSPKLSRSGGNNNLGTCQLKCPRKESSSSGEFKANAECLENSCCRERTAVTGRKSIDMDIDIMTYM